MTQQNSAPRRVLITGGTKGIGKEIALAFQNNGDSVAVIYMHDVEGAKQMEIEHGISTFFCDVSNFQDCQEILPKIIQKLGGNIQILVNNAGITRDKMLHKQDNDGWLSVLQTNLFSVFNMSRAVIENMRTSQYGRIINISSVNAHGALGQTNYAASKAGVEGFTKSLALESARVGVTVNAIAPGYVDTDMVRNMPQEILQSIVSKVPMNRLAKPQEIANTAVFLASNDAAFITGAVIPVNGGLHM